MKKKLLLTSILSVVMCFSLIAGATFALFTSESKVNIAVTSGTVSMVSNVEDLQTWSLEDDKTIAGRTDGTFTQGGSATFNADTLTLNKIIPGDKVGFKVTGANDSDVNVKYRLAFVCEDGVKLMSVLKVDINGTTYTNLHSYKSAWIDLDAGVDMTALPISIELPEEVGNDYQDLTAKISITLTAVQGNADVTGAEEVKIIATDSTSVTKALKSGKGVALTENVTLNGGDIANGATIDLNGHDLTIEEAITAKGDVNITSDVAGSEINLGSSGLIKSSDGTKNHVANISNVTINRTSTTEDLVFYYGDVNVTDTEINVVGDIDTLFDVRANLTVTNTEINVTGSTKSVFYVTGNLTLGEGTVVNVEDTLKSSLIDATGGNLIVDGAKINVEKFNVIGGSLIYKNNATVVEIKNIDLTINSLLISQFGKPWFINKANNVTLISGTYDITGSDASTYNAVEKIDGVVKFVKI